MNSRRLARDASMIVLGLLLAGCGGGGSGGPSSTPPPTPAPSTPTPTAPTPTPSTPTPTPPPPIGANDDLLFPLASETFRNVASAGALTVPLNGATVTTTAGPVELSVVYQADTQAYTVSDGVRSQSFGPADRDPAQSNAALTTYRVTSGGTTDTLSLLASGTGTGQTRYAGGGFWQRQVNGSSTIDGRFTAFAYGVQTAAGAVPRTGTASFDVTLLGASSLETLIYALAGTGSVEADLQTGALATTGRFSQTDATTGITRANFGWQGRGLLSSGANAFAGEIVFDTLGIAEWRGALFGPVAEELGSVFSGNTSFPAGAWSGAILGIRSATPPPVDVLANGSMFDTFFRPLGVSGRAARDGSGNLSSIVAGPPLVALYQDNPAGSLTYYSGDGRIMRTLPGSSSLFAVETLTVLSHVKPSFLIDRRGPTDLFDYFVYGTETANSAIPRVGVGAFNVSLTGTVAAPGQNLQQISGNGAVTANFATGALTTLGNYLVPAALPGTPWGITTPISDSGSWTGTASISSTANAFAGSFAMDGATDYSGTLTGRFYGPAAEELGAVIQAMGPNGALAVGTMVGERGAPTNGQALLDLTATTVLQGSDAQFNTRPALSPSQGTSLASGIEITYDPVAKSYQFKSTSALPGPVPLDRTITDAMRVNTTSTFTFYEGPGFTARLHNPGNTNTPLRPSYTSFAVLEEDVTHQGYATNSHHYILFGGQTPNFQIPISGTATYTGSIFGTGRYGQLIPDASLAGFSTFNVNFGTNAVSMLLEMSASNKLVGTPHATFNLTFDGTLGGFCPGGCNRNTFGLTVSPASGATGTMTGQFNGPNAAEFGATFTFDLPPTVPGQSSTSASFAGVTVGKKN